MHRFIDGEDRLQQTLLPNSLEDYVGEETPVRVVEVFIGELDLAALGFSGMRPAAMGRPAYHPSTLLKIYLYGYLNRIQSSRRLEREAQRNIELMWLVGRLAPDFKTIADFRKDNGAAIQSVCRQFVELCRGLKLFTGAVVAIDGSKFKAVNNRDKNYTVAKVTGRMEQVNASIARYLRALDQADREESDIAEAKSGRLKEKIAGLRRQMKAMMELEQADQDVPDTHVYRGHTRLLHPAGLHLRHRARPLHLPGGGKAHQGKSSGRSHRGLRFLPPPERLLHLPAEVPVHADQAAAHQALGE